MKYKLTLFIVVILILTGCNVGYVSKADSLPTATPQIISPKKDLSEIDLTKIGAIAPKGRVQDKEYNQLPVIDDLISNEKESIPFLIGKLDDETKITEPVMNYWYEIRIGDVALIALTGFFTDASWKNTTIPGVSWDEFLERGKDKDSMGEEILRKYIKKHGRKTIKARWQKIWDENKENIFWDETERCFKLKK